MLHNGVEPKAQRTPGWYQRFFAWMMAHGNADYEAAMRDRKQKLFAGVHGNVLEIGPGTGPNLSYYPHDTHWIGVEPNPYMHSYLRQEAERVGLDIEIRHGTAERLEVEDNSVDAVVSTLVLCSVNDLEGTLKEVLRVLKPGGQFFFLEHVAASQNTRLRKIQNWISPLWQVLGDGCHPNRETWSVLEKVGFEKLDYENFQADAVPALVSPQIIGVATKKAK
ncbi:class I SAM-dependent methyltransferase [Gloeocapsopsis sp. IPPAS B-1203]|uniref:class I SAM-dependent methyltransferase n=1 Tax=Gloeocapsopsis sp. IPPAS B-1203 TaxID=2049454 RepID=UPI000C18501A|nr:class I SAM-dependent methyltransferase [Gloeocapsopsis sp. IPPAS B-1203]PIG90494.1 SAM-dependent methyltransferase [Gloeocapsopsis sp. IPPAS B-1203]